MFHIGQRVVCVDAKPPRPDGNRYLVEGAIYTIRWVGMHHDLHGIYGTHLRVRLEEVRRPRCPKTRVVDMPYGAFRFRPIVERETDISVFEAILDKATKREREPA